MNTELTYPQMFAAHSAWQMRQTERWPCTDVEPPSPEFLAMGEKVLSEYILVYSDKFTCIPPPRPSVAAGEIKVAWGHIATAPAFRMAQFFRRAADK